MFFNHIFRKIKNKGFTLIELLVVVAIISLLSSVVLVSLNTARAKARDVKRISEIKQIQRGLELYIDAHGSLPMPITYGRANVSPGYWDQWWDLSTSTAGAGFLNFLVTDGIFSKTPTDPQNTPTGHNGPPYFSGGRYFYFHVPAGYNYQGGSCNLNSPTYMIGATDLETDPPGAPYVSGSGCDCLWKNLPNAFQGQFDYIICGQY
ncbi:type II secretion system protein [Candidatus Nomurabacteria bacterium]|nr:type II secretion system protein [Candidatus Nomurabacteria bacterium]